MNNPTNNSNESEQSIKEVSLLGLFAGNNLIVPEIQREYVWGDEIIGHRVLGGFFADFLKNAGKYRDQRVEFARMSECLKMAVRNLLVNSGYPEIKDDKIASFSDSVIQDALAVRAVQLDSRVGFVYAYIPGFAKDGAERTLPAYLIDGQQRITTFFLIWLHLSDKANKKENFKNAIRYGGTNLAFDFKVRPLTHEFINELVNEVINSASFDFSAIEDATWFLADYRYDVSIMSMVNALKVWNEMWAQSGLDAGIAYEYLTKHVSFWLFVMNETAQGEQLYITMNGRGKNLSEDEIIRAKVFRDAVTDGEHNATDVGTLFEDMTDFFWRHRVKGEFSSDKGMKKFFRWVYLLDRYEKEQDMANKPESQFAAALTNKDEKDGKGFELREEMFGQDEKTGKDCITFTLIEKSFLNLRQLYEPELRGKVFLRDSVLAEADSESSFQQDSFMILPLLHWLNSRTQNQKLDSNDIIRFARYLRKMASKNDVQSSPAQAVPNAIKFADRFASYANGDLLNFLSEDSTNSEGFSKMVLPEEESAKAKRLCALRNQNPALFSKFEKLLDEIEDYKSSKLENDYQIAGFLGIKEEWGTVDWDQDLFDEYSSSFDCFKQFWDSPHTLRKFRLLVSPEIGGYYENKMKLFPYSLVSMMGDTSKIHKIIEFEKQSIRDGVKVAFGTSEYTFLQDHWKSRNEEKNPCVLCALALISQRLFTHSDSSRCRKVQFEHTYYEKKKPVPDAKQRTIGAAKLYFWFLDDSASNWRYSAAIESNLLECHKMSSDKVTNKVEQWQRVWKGCQSRRRLRSNSSIDHSVIDKSGNDC